MTESRRSKPSHAEGYLHRFKQFVLPPHYHEQIVVKDGFPIKSNYKDRQLVGVTVLANPLGSKEFVEDELAPTFAEGRCVLLAECAYKIVMIDREGTSDKVFKLYKQHIYRGKRAQEHAQAAATKIGIVNELVEQIAPGYVLPNQVVVNENNGYFMVYEIQNRALTVPIDFFDPKKAEKLHKEAHDVTINGGKKLREELLRRELSRRDPFFGEITDDISLTEIHWDIITNHLVSLDIVDQVDIVPLVSRLQE